MSSVLHHKIVSTLPGVLAANSIYYVRVGAGFDHYVTNSSGTIVAYESNAKLLAEANSESVITIRFYDSAGVLRHIPADTNGELSLLLSNEDLSSLPISGVLI